MDETRRSLLLGGAALAAGATLAPTRALAQSDVFRPEDFGARGDGRSDDTDAFKALSEAVNRSGGGVIELRARAIYLVGRQTPAAADNPFFSFVPEDIINLQRLAGPLTIRGNGARLRCVPGLRYGTFDRATGAATERPMPFTDRREMASPYYAMVHVHDCLGPITIENLELDGNLPALRIGGPFGDTGRQVPASGILLSGNVGGETVRGVHSHHHGLDGIMLAGLPDRQARGRFENVRCEYNGRQGVSIIGGRGYDFARCQFNHTGRSAVSSAPGAGVDIEAEGGTNRDLTFTDCEFVNNAGVGMVADSGDSEDARFARCLFVGTTAWSAWPKKPRFRFDDCTFVGSVVQVFADADPARATQFRGCRFLDAHPRAGGKVFLGEPGGGPIVNMAASDNVLFDRCEFRLTGRGLLPWGWRATYRDCAMSQAAPGQAYPKGRYLGRSSIRGNVDLCGTKVDGELTVNGNSVPRGQHGGEPW